MFLQNSLAERLKRESRSDGSKGMAFDIRVVAINDAYGRLSVVARVIFVCG